MSMKALRSTAFGSVAVMTGPGLANYAQRVLTTADPVEKVRLTQEAAAAWDREQLIGEWRTPPIRPARPAEPLIVAPGDMPSVKECGAPSNVFHLHGLAHVELNAIDLCFDTMLRFADGTAEAPGGINSWYKDWISVAVDEARHFSGLNARLQALGSCYGALPAHGLIWAGADASRDSRRDRIALGQLVAEARALDAGPRLAQRILGTGDKESATLVNMIADEEVRHVGVGVKWFLWECQRTDSDPIEEFHRIALRAASPGAFLPPFNRERRAAAGLTPDWYLPIAEMMEIMHVERRKQDKASRVNVSPSKSTA